MKKKLLIILSTILLISSVLGCTLNNSESSNNDTSALSDTSVSEAVSSSEVVSVTKTSKETSAVSKITSTTETVSSTTAAKAEKTSKKSKVAKTSTTSKKHTVTKAKKHVATKTKKTTTIKAHTQKTKKTETSSYSEAQNICYITIECKSVLDNMNKLKEGHESFVPKNGIILNKTKCAISDNNTAYDVLASACSSKNIKLTSRNTMYGIYVSGINNLDEFDCGSASGWVYTVNSKSPNKSCGKYTVSKGDEIIFKYVC